MHFCRSCLDGKGIILAKCLKILQFLTRLTFLQADEEFEKQLKDVDQLCIDFFNSELDSKLASVFPRGAPSMQGHLHLRGSGYSRSDVRDHLHIVMGAPDCFQAKTSIGSCAPRAICAAQHIDAGRFCRTNLRTPDPPCECTPIRRARSFLFEHSRVNRRPKSL